jgi:hypothetical protein
MARRDASFAGIARGHFLQPRIVPFSRRYARGLRESMGLLVPISWRCFIISQPTIILACIPQRISTAKESNAAGHREPTPLTGAAAAGVKRSVDNRHRSESAMDWYSIRFASGRISPNLGPQVGDCWLDTTGEPRRAQRPGRYKARDALPRPRGQRALRNGRPRPPRQTVHKVPPRLPGECCRPNRWRHGDRLALAEHALRSRPAHSTAARRAKARMRSLGVG